MILSLLSVYSVYAIYVSEKEVYAHDIKWEVYKEVSNKKLSVPFTYIALPPFYLPFGGD